jgi:hypothetical protein
MKKRDLPISYPATLLPALRQRYHCGHLARQILLLLSFVGASSETVEAQAVDPLTVEPFTVSARWSQYLHRTFGATRLGILAVETAADQAFGAPGCWDDSASSYVQRYARAFDRRLIRNTTELIDPKHDRIRDRDPDGGRPAVSEIAIARYSGTILERRTGFYGGSHA